MNRSPRSDMLPPVARAFAVLGPEVRAALMQARDLIPKVAERRLPAAARCS